MGEYEDKNGSPDILCIRRFTCPLMMAGQECFAFILVKESLGKVKERGGERVTERKIYTVELEKIEALGGELGRLEKLKHFLSPSTEVMLAVLMRLSSLIRDVSKVVDENGEPLVVYHGTEELFDAFDMSKGWDNYVRGKEAEMSVSMAARWMPRLPEGEAEMKEIEKNAKADGTWLNAPNGEDSNLADMPELWCVVRTKGFKGWFGDWDTYARIQEIMNMPAVSLVPHLSMDKKQVKGGTREFGEITNKRDGRVVKIPGESAGKIFYHKGFDSSSIAMFYKSLFEDAIPAYRANEVQMAGHKFHDNYEYYQHYVNKFTVGGDEYFIRFTVTKIRNSNDANNMHSTAISEVAIYGKSTLHVTPRNTVGKSGYSFTDSKLMDFFASVNEKDVSKVVDENGEPLLVYHGTEELFDAFDMSKGWDNYVRGKEAEVSVSMAARWMPRLPEGEGE